MSGFKGNRPGVFGLTATKAKYWHNWDGQPCGKWGDLDHVVAEHLLPAGFVVVKDGRGSYVDVTGPGLDEGKTARIYEAVSGREAWEDR